MLDQESGRARDKILRILPVIAVFANVSSKLGLWLITREKNQLPLGDGSWLKKGGV